MFNVSSVFSAKTASAKLKYENSTRAWKYVSTHDSINQTSLYRAIGADTVKSAIRAGVITYSVDPIAFGSSVEYSWSHDGVTCYGTRADFIHDAMGGGSVMLLQVTHKPTAKSGRRYSYHVTPEATLLLDDMHRDYLASAEYDINVAREQLNKLQVA